MVQEFNRSSAGTTFTTIHDDEVGQYLRLDHGLADRQELGGLADAEFEAGWFSTALLTENLDELEQFYGCREGTVEGR